MVAKFRMPLVALAMAVYFSFLSFSPAMAGLVDSVSSTLQGSSQSREDDIRKVQVALETQMVKEKLSAYGLSPEEINEKLQNMSDQQIHLLAQASDGVLAGGNGLGAVIAVLVIILLVIVIMKLLNKSIIIK
jgi:uncharacterized BrkB/YihY/UPF0761 family membrane protein